MMWYTVNGWGWWNRPSGEPTVLEILERRDASSELSHDKFEAMRQRLTKAGSPVAATGRGDDAGRMN